ncbi:MAG: TniQ family protein [Proteobacteria bacterium]|nr:TniQ family protein [Pseudomonadota bacterium]
MTRGKSRREQLSRLRNNLNPLYVATEKPRRPAAHRLPGAPNPLPGEVFSSWHWRIQTFLRLPTKVLQAALGVDALPYWIDTGACRLDIERMAYAVMHTTKSLEALTWPQSSMLSDPHYCCLTTTPLRRRPIVRYCEICLRTDPVPYIRTLWRIACAYLCPTHGVVLRELCPSCHQPFELPRYKPNQSSRQLRRCHACGADLCDVESSALPEDLRYLVLARQAELLQLVAGKSHLLEVWPELRTQEAYCFGSEASGLIDMGTEQNVRMLFAHVLNARFRQTKQTVGQSKRTLNSYLLKISVRERGGKASTLPVALDGTKVFGKHALTVCKHLVGRQDLWGGTHWWPVEYMRFMLPSDVFNAKDFAAAATWSAKFAQLARGRN